MTRRDGNKSSLLCRSVAACSARSNCGSSPCSPPSGGCAWLRSSRYAANLTGPARDCLQSGRSGRRNSRLDRTKEHLSDIIKRLQTEVSTEYSHAPSAAETINASHTEILTVPTWRTLANLARSATPSMGYYYCVCSPCSRAPSALPGLPYSGSKRLGCFAAFARSRMARLPTIAWATSWPRSTPSSLKGSVANSSRQRIMPLPRLKVSSRANKTAAPGTGAPRPSTDVCGSCA